MQLNDLPIVCLPMELSDEAAAQLLDFLYQLAEALERHYTGQLLRYAHRHDDCDRQLDLLNSTSTDPPF